MGKASSLHDRMNLVAGERSYRELGELTGTNAETVRRYMQGQAPSVEFLAGLARSLNLSGTWLLSGVGPRHTDEVKGAALREADASELLSAMAETISMMMDRIQRLEIFVQTMEARLRATSEPGEAEERRDGSEIHGRARRIGDAAAQRPPADAR